MERETRMPEATTVTETPIAAALGFAGLAVSTALLGAYYEDASIPERSSG